MSDFSVRSDNVDVEQIMRQIRSRIREKRGVDYTEEEVRELASVRLEKFIDPKGVRSGLLEEYRRVSTAEPAAPNYAFGEETLYETHRGPIRWIRSLLRPLLKMLFNPNPLIQALHIQADLNQRNAERWAKREQLDSLHYEVIHNLVVEVTRNTLEVKTLKMRLESMASRLDFDERRARALEGVVQYRAGSVAPLQPPTGQDRGRQDHRRDQGRQQQGQRPQGPRDQRPRDQGPRDQGSRDQAARNPAPAEHAGGAQASGEPGSAATDQGLTAGAPGANALDNDGNERRSRRRRRRGRRRPSDERGPTGDARGPMFDTSAATGSESNSGGAEPASFSEENATAAPASDPIGYRPASARAESHAGSGEVSPKPLRGEGGTPAGESSQTSEPAPPSERDPQSE